MTKDFLGRDIKVGSKIVYVTYCNNGYRRPGIYLNSGEVTDIFEKDFHDWRGKCDILQVKKDVDGKVVNVMALMRVVVIPEEIPLMIPSVFGTGETVMFGDPDARIDPVELPKLDTGITITYTTSQKTPFETILDNLAQITPEQRSELTKTLLKDSINLGLEDLGDEK